MFEISLGGSGRPEPARPARSYPNREKLCKYPPVRLPGESYGVAYAVVSAEAEPFVQAGDNACQMLRGQLPATIKEGIPQPVLQGAIGPSNDVFICLALLGQTTLLHL